MDDTNKKPETKTVRATRDAVVRGAERVKKLKQKSNEVASKVKGTWDGSRKTREDLKHAVGKAVAFGRDVGQGLKEGIADVQKKNTEGV